MTEGTASTTTPVRPEGILNRRKRPGLPPLTQPVREKRLRVRQRGNSVALSAGPRHTWAWDIIRATHRDIDLYNYSQLGPDQIRILLLQPSDDPEAELKVRLRPCTIEELQNDRAFAALSYTWGTGEADHPVLVDEPDKLLHVADVVMALSKEQEDKRTVRAKRFMVKPNLYNALKRLRIREHEIAVWIDAICINQMDNAEKKVQVPRMFQIYSAADIVYVWLGEADKHGRTDEAMQFIPKVVEAVEVDELINDDYLEKWNNLLYLMRSAWFSRRWIIQELALARNAEVRCGKQAVSWRDFSDAISLFVRHYEQIGDLFKRNSELTKDTDIITDVNPLGAKILVDELSNTFLRSGKDVFEPVKDLETLVSTLSTFDTGDPRDTIYSLLNIARERSIGPNDDPNPPPEPDYSKNLLQVYNEFVKWVIKRNKSLDIICRQWALPERTDTPPPSYPRPLCILPSWIKTVPDSAFGRQQEGFSGRKNGESLVGLPGRSLYNASYGKQPTLAHVNSWKVPKPRPVGPGLMLLPNSHTSQAQFRDQYRASLVVEGIELGVVEDNTDPIADGVIPQWALKKLGWNPNDEAEDHETVPDRVWRTLVADGDENGQKPPAWYHRACLRSLARDTPNGHLNTRQLLMKTPPLSLICRDYLKRVQAVTWNRVVLQTEGEESEDALVGIGPPSTKRNDVVCILFGCSVPCILRKTWSKPGNATQLQEDEETDPLARGPNYEFIGEAFIYGKMDGQAIANLSKEDLKARTKQFCLV